MSKRRSRPAPRFIVLSSKCRPTAAPALMRELVKVLKNYALVRRELVAVVGVEPTEAVGYEKATENTVAFLFGQFSDQLESENSPSPNNRSLSRQGKRYALKQAFMP